MLNFITNINWSDPVIIGIIVGVIAVFGTGGYLWWAWSKNEWPF